MRTKAFIGVAAFLGVLVLLGGAAYAYDNSRDDEIAPGIRVAGIAVGGMTPADARAKLEAGLLAPLRETVVVHRDGSSWRLGPREARTTIDLDGAVSDAIDRGRSGGLLARTWRSLTGRRVDADVDAKVRHSSDAVQRLLVRVRRAVNRDPRDAKVDLSGEGVAVAAARNGRALRSDELKREVNAAIDSPSASRSISAHAVTIKPKVGSARLADQYGTIVIVNRSAFRLRLYKRLRLAETYKIAVGQVGLETPAGQYKIANKAINPAWHVPDSDWAGDLAGKVIAGDDPSNPIKARWLGIYDGVGIHGTSDDASIGSNASHGCIRMHVADVERLYDEVPVGSPIYIA